MATSEKKPQQDPPTEVVAKATRRRFTAKYKLKILKKADACEAHGALGELLRKEGLYTSHLALWRKQRELGVIAGLAPKKRGPKPVERDERDEQIEALRKELDTLTARAERAEALLELQKKVAELLSTATRGTR
jgi:transposase-like protein